MAGRYCVNPEIPANKVAIAVDGWVNGMTPHGVRLNACDALRADFGACGLEGKYFELRTEPDCIMGSVIEPVGGDYVEWAKKSKHQYSPETQAMLDAYIKEQEA